MNLLEEGNKGNGGSASDDDAKERSAPRSSEEEVEKPWPLSLI